MQPLKGIVMSMLAGTLMLAQEPNTPAANKPLTGDPGVQAAPAAQTPPAQSKTSMARSDANSLNFTGTIVDANCSQASSLTMRYSAADAAAKPSPASTTTDKNYKSVYDLQREVLKHCPATNSTTAFAVVTDDGSFYKLDDAGNTQVTSLSGAAESEKQKKTLKNMRVTGSGTVQGDTLKVGSLTKSDKPFGGS